ncbi:MAG: peptide deformylase [Fibrobacteraceae bacterium]|nr:peptide deformylase [Fibrobacteraceae bacterium]
MAVLPICKYGDPILRKKCEPVKEITPELRKLALDMLETMYDAPGVGLAAPQIGKNIRLVVIDVSHPEDEEKDPHIMFNPEWEPESDAEMVDYDEGCLSVPDIFCNVVRPDRVTVRYNDIDGNPVEIKNCDELFARCIQHECDHLEGDLFVDKISTADRTLNQSKLRKMAKETKENLAKKSKR